MFEKKKENVKHLGFATSAVLALALTGICASWAGAAAVTTDYSDNFTYNDNSTPANFTTSLTTSLADGGATTSFKVVSDTFRYALSGSATSAGVNVLGSSVVQVSNLGGPAATAQSFTLSSKLKLNTDDTALTNATGSKTVNLGLVALGTASGGALIDAGDFDPSNFYWGNVVIARSSTGIALGTVLLGGNGFNVSGPTQISITTTDTYLFTLTGNYVGSSLDLDFTVTDLTTSQSVTASIVDTNPLTGNFFGYRHRTTSQAQGLNIKASFDNFQISAIPEPATAALGMLAFAAVVRRKRRIA